MAVGRFITEVGVPSSCLLSGARESHRGRIPSAPLSSSMTVLQCTKSQIHTSAVLVWNP